MAAPEPWAIARDGAPAPVVTQRHGLRLGDSMIMGSFGRYVVETTHDHGITQPEPVPLSHQTPRTSVPVRLNDMNSGVMSSAANPDTEPSLTPSRA